MNDEKKENIERDGSSFKPIGLHFCKRYRNLVRYDPEFCGSCPFNGFRAEPE